MIHERDFIDLFYNNDGDVVAFGRAIERLAAEYEREACAKICETMHEEDRPGDYAYAIRGARNDRS